MIIVNLTPHMVNIVGGSAPLSIPSSGLARVAEERTTGTSVVVGDISIPVSFSKLGAVTGLPDAVTGTIYVVSAMVRDAVPYRTDVYSPGPLVRGPDGQPVGCQGLTGNAPEAVRQGQDGRWRSVRTGRFAKVP